MKTQLFFLAILLIGATAYTQMHTPAVVAIGGCEPGHNEPAQPLPAPPDRDNFPIGNAHAG